MVEQHSLVHVHCVATRVCMCMCMFRCVYVVPYDFQLHTHIHTHSYSTHVHMHTHTHTLLLHHAHSLLLTTFCLEHRPTVVACVCIHLAATWKGEDFTNLSSQRSNWWEYVDPSVTLEQLNGKKSVLVQHPLCTSLTVTCMSLSV